MSPSRLSPGKMSPDEPSPGQLPSGETPSSSLLVTEAARQMTICNACRYCEGYCPVFPAMELRTAFDKGDISYLANLCHDCQTCYHACQYAPPHEFAIDIPTVFAKLRVATYAEHSRPRALSRLLNKGHMAIALTCFVAPIAVVLLTLLLAGVTSSLSAHRGPGAFYEVIPYPAMVGPAVAALLWSASVLALGFLRFWRQIGGRPIQLLDLRAHLRTFAEALTLEHMKGGGEGCTYPDERFSTSRRTLHHLVAWGFGLDLASTTVAAFYENFLGRIAPFPIWSWPVVLGASGGFAMLIGCAGLLALKRRRDPDPSADPSRAMDVSFLILLFLISATGLLLLALRDSSAMGLLLAVHLGVVAGLFLTLPYGKFAHVVYRYAALLRNTIERSPDAR